MQFILWKTAIIATEEYEESYTKKTTSFGMKMFN